MNGYLREGGRRGLDPAWRVLPTGGLAGLPLLAALLGAPLEAAVLLEVGAGHPGVQALADQGVVLPERLLALTELTGQSEAGLEDLFDEAFYLRLLAATGAVEELKAGRAGRRGVDRPAGRAGHRRRRRPLPRPCILGQQRACCRPSAASPCTASPGCSPPWTSCSLGVVPPLRGAEPAAAAGRLRPLRRRPGAGPGAAPGGAGWAAEQVRGAWRPRRRPGGDRLGQGGRPTRRCCAPTASGAGSTRSSSTRPGTGCWPRRSSTASTPAPGATRVRVPKVARAAGFYLWTQVEAGHGCPVNMTFAAVPALRTTPSWPRRGSPG